MDHNVNVGKGSTGAKIELEHAVAIGFDDISFYIFKGEAIVAPLGICVCRKNGAVVSTRVGHEAFSVITLMNIKYAASSGITRRQHRY